MCPGASEDAAGCAGSSTWAIDSDPPHVPPFDSSDAAAPSVGAGSAALAAGAAAGGGATGISSSATATTGTATGTASGDTMGAVRGAVRLTVSPGRAEGGRSARSCVASGAGAAARVGRCSEPSTTTLGMSDEYICTCA
eukprot:scaffold33457_cov90-Isochrysis_galbana.AAC.4